MYIVFSVEWNDIGILIRTISLSNREFAASMRILKQHNELLSSNSSSRFI